MKVIRVFCCVAVLALAATAQPQPDGGMDDFIAVSNSVYNAAMNNWMGLPQARYPLKPKETFEQLRFIFDMMNLLSTSKVEVICYQGLGFDSGSLVYWMTDEAVYEIEFPRDIFLEKESSYRHNYNLSIAKMVRTKTFDAELDAFESLPLTKRMMGVHDASLGFYVRRTPDGTFESIYFPVVTSSRPTPIPDDADEQRAEIIKKINEAKKTDKMLVFGNLFETFAKLMAKRVVGLDEGIPRVYMKQGLCE